MKIALISPRVSFDTKIAGLNEYWESSIEAKLYKSLWSGSSISLLILASLTPKNISISYIDENFHPIFFDEHFDLVAITAMTQQATRCFQIGDEFRKRKVKVIIGGIHSSILPEESILHADSVVAGEAEDLWPQILEDLSKNNLQQFYFSQSEIDLTKSPIPRYDLLNHNNYHYFWVQVSRGCSHDCEFCASSKVFGKKYRIKNISQVVQELSYIKSIYSKKTISFADDNFFTKRDFSMALIKELSDLKISWQAQTDIGIGEDSELLYLARKSGCRLLFIGLESLSEESLCGIDSQNWKLKKLKNYTKNIQNIQKNGIGVMGSFIIGLDGDDSSIIDKTSDFIIENNLFNANINILTPLPGTRIRERLIKENRVLPLSWDNYTGLNVTFIPKKISVREIESGIVEIFKRIYSKEVYYKKIQYFKDIQKLLLTCEQNVAY